MPSLAEDEGGAASKGPSNNIYLQQKMPVKQLVFTTRCVLITLLCTGVVFVAVGSVCLDFAGRVQQFQFTYGGAGACVNPCPAKVLVEGVSVQAGRCPDAEVGGGGANPCLVTFKLAEDIPGPVFFYYSLDNFHQNHRRYVPSIDQNQMIGSFGTEDPGSEPPGYSGCSFAEGYEVDGKMVYYYPCGLIARTLFNDTFALSGPDGAVNWTSQGISFRNQGDRRFVSKDTAWLMANCYKLGGYDFDESGFGSDIFGAFRGTNNVSASRYDCWHYVGHEELNVWMRTATTSSFWKLHRIIEGGLRAGDYQLSVGINFPVKAFGGKKGFVLSNATPFGGSRVAIGIAYVGTGILALVAAIFFLVLASVRDKGKKPEIRYPDVVVREAVKKGGRSCFPKSMPKQSNHGGPTEDQKRQVACPPPAHGSVEAKQFASNFVSTTKYTRWNFIPLNLLVQFQRFANCYFLGIAIMASIEAISPVSGTTFWFPLFIVIFFTAAKDANEDYRRHQSDIEENSRLTEMFDYSAGDFKKVPWRDLTVGSIVRVTTLDDGCSPMIPADLSLLATSAEDGACFIETANLDGETNLKIREAPEVLHKDLTRDAGHAPDGSKIAELRNEQVAQHASKIVCGQPDAFLYDFNARMEWRGQDIALSGGTSGGQFLQRSTKLKNSKWCVGIAVYTGPQTKIQQNMSDPPNKVSNIERRLNSFILMLFMFQGVLCITGAIGAGVWMGRDETRYAWYLAFPDGVTSAFNVDNPAQSGIIAFFSYLILLSLLIPISLYVSVEFVKAYVAFQISSDREMYVEEDDIPSKARSAGLCEELGQVNYIFSDKTGTLTQNLMEFKKCSIGGIEYGRGYCEVERAIARRNGRSLPADPPPPAGLDPGFRFVDERLLFGKWRETQDPNKVRLFLLNLAINHTVQVEFSPTSNVPIFQAESPDEGAFVTAARNLGFFFSKRMMKDISINVSNGPVGQGSEERWTVLNSNAFDNNRKRTSVVVKDPQGALFLFVKGADTSVMPFVDYNACPYFDETQAHIDKFSDQGLRTLVFAGRKLSEGEYAEWNKRYVQCSLMSEGRESAMRQIAVTLEEKHEGFDQPSALFDSSTRYSKALTLHGVTALEDKLQENVGDTISQLAKAMIKIWVLTGDKLETAINIGYATALLSNEMEPLHRIAQDDLNSKDDTEVSSALEQALVTAIRCIRNKDLAGLVTVANNGMRVTGGSDVMSPVMATCKKLGESTGQSEASITADLSQIEARLKEALLKERVRQKLEEVDAETAKPRAGGHALVIDGPCLRACMEDKLKMQFLNVGVRCKAVVCCRVTPSQKAQVTLLVKDNMPGQITLAIGDGANDVSMIQAAHIGVGIRGKEGQQAVLASDYALPRFCFLERLLIIHGRWSYNRIGTMVCYFFYKNIAFALTLFWFSLFNGFSAQPLFDDGYQSLYNVLYTSLPVMVFAALDRDLEPWVVRAKPELYSTGHWNVRFNSTRFFMFILGAILHSLLIYFIAVNTLDTNLPNQDGRVHGLWSSGTTVLTCVVFVVNIVMGIHTRSWCWIHWLIYCGSVFMWFFFIMVYHAISPYGWQFFNTALNVYWLFYELADVLVYWLTIFVVIAVCCLPILCYKYFTEHYFPGIDDYYRRVVKDPHNYPNELVQVDANIPGAPIMPMEIHIPVSLGLSGYIHAGDNGSAAASSGIPTPVGQTPRVQPSSAGNSRIDPPIIGTHLHASVKQMLERNKDVQTEVPTRSDFTPAPDSIHRTESIRSVGSHGDPISVAGEIERQ